MSKVIITQVRSAINRTKRQKATIQALGIKKLNQIAVKKTLGVVIIIAGLKFIFT